MIDFLMLLAILTALLLACAIWSFVVWPDDDDWPEIEGDE